MAIFENAAIALLLTVSMVAANQPEFLSQSPQPYRSFTDRQDKFNGNYNEAMDNLNAGNTKRLRAGSSPSVVGSNSESFSTGYRSQFGNNNARQQPTSTSRQYEVPDYDQTVNRNGDSTYYSETNPSSFVQSPASRKTFAAGKSSNLAMVVSPLAGIAFVAAAAAVAISPVYLTLTSSILSGRKKRDLSSMIDPSMADKITPEMMQKIQELQTLEKFLASIPKETDYQQQIMSMYLSCSGYTREGNVCLDRIFCEYGNANSNISDEERDVLSIVLYNIMSNTFIPVEYKQRLRSAARIGRDFQQCNRYDCPALSESSSRF
ncbi:uncharacterized protein LOC124209641 [Daphnia pulex]|uniref:uncharacterized protein LOC124209641 n=1 Tax=Daphnia pulex TaxID=6669 RepID=UPI001EDDBE63|nr:uncharacterized protein LOC124209641 [Daphnia pulex]